MDVKLRAQGGDQVSFHFAACDGASFNVQKKSRRLRVVFGDASAVGDQG
jgi:hypothetical protein